MAADLSGLAVARRPVDQLGFPAPGPQRLQWGARQLAKVTQNALGGPEVYLNTGNNFSGTVATAPQGLDQPMRPPPG